MTRDASQVTFKKKYHDSKCARGYDQVLEKRLTGMSASLTTEIMAVDKALGLFWDENKRITLDMLGQRQSIKGGELLLIPISPSDMTAYRFPHAIPLLINGTYSFSVDREHTMTLEFEANYVDGEEILFEKIPVDEAQRTEILPAEIDSASLERAMTSYIADKLDMSVDTDVFRGCVPVNTDGCVVALTGEQPRSTLTSRRYEFNVAYFDRDRSKTMNTIDKLARQLPIYGESIILDEENTVILKAVLGGACNFNWQIADDGELKTLANLSLTVII